MPALHLETTFCYLPYRVVTVTGVVVDEYGATLPVRNVELVSGRRGETDDERAVGRRHSLLPQRELASYGFGELLRVIHASLTPCSATAEVPRT